FEMEAMRATPPSLRMSAGTRSSAMTAEAPARSAISACSALVTSMITPPFSISASPTLSRNVSSRYFMLFSPSYWSYQRGGSFGEGGDGRRLGADQSPENRDAAPDLLRGEAGEAQPQGARVRARHGEEFSRNEEHLRGARARQKLAGVDGARQFEPQMQAAL